MPKNTLHLFNLNLGARYTEELEFSTSIFSISLPNRGNIRSPFKLQMKHTEAHSNIDA
ncbi:MAG: hypothetical protein WC252_05035 [Candidatus Cloacimonadaceae bacterium]